MLVRYVTGYGRSGSTALASVLAGERPSVNLGEVANLARRELSVDQSCSCGRSFAVCSYWSAVVEELTELQRLGRARFTAMSWLEGWPGLLVPAVLLRRIVQRRAFARSTPSISYAEGIQLLVGRVGGPLVDSSKTTRLSANRPRLLAACGLEVELHLPVRAFSQIVRSYRDSLSRTGSSRHSGAAPVVVGFGLLTSHLSARWCALLLRRRLVVHDFDEVMASLPNLGVADPASPFGDHLFGGNRRQLRRERDDDHDTA